MNKIDKIILIILLILSKFSLVARCPETIPCRIQDGRNSIDLRCDVNGALMKHAEDGNDK